MQVEYVDIYTVVTLLAYKYECMFTKHFKTA